MAECGANGTLPEEPAITKLERQDCLLREEERLAETELERQNRLLREENERLKKEREEYRKTLPLKERLYDHINVSVKAMDMIIVVLFILLGIVLLLGIISSQ